MSLHYKTANDEMKLIWTRDGNIQILKLVIVKTPCLAFILQIEILDVYTEEQKAKMESADIEERKAAWKEHESFVKGAVIEQTEKALSLQRSEVEKYEILEQLNNRLETKAIEGNGALHFGWKVKIVYFLVQKTQNAST